MTRIETAPGAGTDVIVVGAGFTGLSAAQALLDLGLSVTLLEARDAPGGRVRSFTLPDGTRRDSGGQFFCDDMPEIMGLVETFGMEPVESRGDGYPKRVRSRDGAVEQAREDDGSGALTDALSDADPDDPAIAGLSVMDWLDLQGAPDPARWSFLGMVHGLWCRPAGEIPFWHLVDSVRRNTSDGNELQYFLRESAAGLCEAMAKRLTPHLRLGSPVTRIVRGKDSVIVETGSERLSENLAERLAARHVLVAVPPVRAREIVQEPPLPETLVAALSAWRSGVVIKVFCRYAQRSWSPALSSGLAWEDASGFYAFDASITEALAGFVVFIAGPLALDWRQRGEDFIREEVRHRLGAVLGPRGGELIDIAVHDWTDDRWSGGGYSDVIVDERAHDAEARIREGVQGVSFASSEMSPSFPTYIEGAIVAGRAAARRIADILGADGTSRPARDPISRF